MYIRPQIDSCWDGTAQETKNYRTAGEQPDCGFVEVGYARVAVKDEYDAWLTVYVDYSQTIDTETSHSLYDWYVVAFQDMSGFGDQKKREVVIGEGPELKALLSRGYLKRFGITQKPMWWGINNGLLGAAFLDWLKKNKHDISELEEEN